MPERGRRLAGAALLWLMALAGCAPLPPRAQALPTAAVQAPLAQQVTVHGRGGPVGPAGTQRAIDAVKAEGRPDLAEHHLRVLATSGEVDLYRGNSTRLLVDGPATYAAMFAAIERARGRVLLESYIVEDGGIAERLAALLARKVKQGVAVALMYDAVGSLGAEPAYFDALAASGVAVCKFNPVNPLERPGYWGINHRNHRKVLVVDEEVAFTGGINIARVYSSGSSPGRGGPAKGDDVLEDGWRDTHIELRGPVVPAFGRGFAAVWHSQGCQGALGKPAPPQAAAPGQRVVKLMESDPRDSHNRIYSSLLAAIDAAQRSVHVTMAYFAPGPEMIDALVAAAQRGVEVALVLPGQSDFTLVLHAGRSYYTRLLAAGVRIHEMDSAVMHAKTAVIDGVFSTIGSSNLDWRSFVANNEVNVVVLGDDFGRELEALFAQDLANSRRIEPAAWRERGIKARVMEQIGRLAERLL